MPLRVTGFIEPGRAVAILRPGPPTLTGGMHPHTRVELFPTTPPNQTHHSSNMRFGRRSILTALVPHGVVCETVRPCHWRKLRGPCLKASRSWGMKPNAYGTPNSKYIYTEILANEELTRLSMRVSRLGSDHLVQPQDPFVLGTSCRQGNVVEQNIIRVREQSASVYGASKSLNQAHRSHSWFASSRHHESSSHLQALEKSQSNRGKGQEGATHNTPHFHHIDCRKIAVSDSPSSPRKI